MSSVGNIYVDSSMIDTRYSQYMLNYLTNEPSGGVIGKDISFNGISYNIQGTSSLVTQALMSDRDASFSSLRCGGISTFGNLVLQGNTLVHKDNHASMSSAYIIKVTDQGRVRINSFSDKNIEFRNNNSTSDLMKLTPDGTVEILGTLNAGGNRFPTNTGADGQVLTTNGAGTLSWQNSSAGGGGGDQLESDSTFSNIEFKINDSQDATQYRHPNNPSIFVDNNRLLQFASNDGHYLQAGHLDGIDLTHIFIEPGYFEGNREYVNYSDDRLKFNEKDITNSLHLIRQITPKKYNKSSLLNQELSTKQEAGLIAQDILLINDLSWCVGGGDYYDQSNNLIEKSYKLAYNSLSMYHLAATKELDAKNTALEHKVAQLEQENITMKTALNTLLAGQGLPQI